MRSLSPKPVLDQQLLTQVFEDNGISLKHAQTIWRYLIQNGTTDYAEIPYLPKKALALLKDFAITTSKVLERTDNKDGSTTKLLIELQDGQRIEAVIMRYGDVALSSFPVEEKEKMFANGEYKFKSNRRATLCVSSQVGCAMGCTFCATGTMNLLANLTAGEILEQLYHANKIEQIRNVVFMGMGEPLDNYDAVLSAVRAMTDTARFGLSPSRISVSTVGVVPRMLSMARDMPDVGLALSLHAPTQDLRIQIVPTAKAWHISKIIDAAEKFIAQQNQGVKSHNRRRHALIEYVLIADVNSSAEVAHQLGALLQDRDVLLNVIPYNPTDVPYDYKPPAAETTRQFVDIIRNTYNVHTLLRQELGQDISSACGQLVLDSVRKPKAACDDSIGDLEDIGVTKSRLDSRKKLNSSTKKSTRTKPTPTKPRNWLPYLIVTLAVVLLARMVSKMLLKL